MTKGNVISYGFIKKQIEKWIGKKVDIEEAIKKDKSSILQVELLESNFYIGILKDLINDIDEEHPEIKQNYLKSIPKDN